MLLGIILGFTAATSNSVAYLFSRAFMQKHGDCYFHLLAVSHIIMGVLSAIIAAAMWPENMPGFRVYAVSLFGASLFYYGGQACLFLALKKVEASRLSPMLGAKIIILAIISVTFLDHTFTSLQWIAIGFSFFAAALLSGTGGRVPTIAIIWISATCLGYCMSDLNIVGLISHFEREMGLIPAALFTTALCYIICGIISVALLFTISGTTKTMWKDAVPFSVLWYTAMLCLFGCFGSLGVIYGNLIQSTRGIISVVLAAFVSLMGFHGLEQKVSRSVLIKRICAAGLMTAAVAIFYLN